MRLKHGGGSGGGGGHGCGGDGKRVVVSSFVGGDQDGHVLSASLNLKILGPKKNKKVSISHKRKLLVISFE